MPENFLWGGSPKPIFRLVFTIFIIFRRIVTLGRNVLKTSATMSRVGGLIKPNRGDGVGHFFFTRQKARGSLGGSTNRGGLGNFPVDAQRLGEYPIFPYKQSAPWVQIFLKRRGCDCPVLTHRRILLLRPLGLRDGIGLQKFPLWDFPFTNRG